MALVAVLEVDDRACELSRGLEIGNVRTIGERGCIPLREMMVHMRKAVRVSAKGKIKNRTTKSEAVYA